MTREDLMAFAAARQKAWDTHDAHLLASGHAAHGVVVRPICGEVHGRAAIEHSYADLFTIFSDWQFEGAPLIIDGNEVVEPFTVCATHTKDFLGVPGSGRRFKIRGVLLFTFENGEVAREERIYDFSAMLIQLGVLKAKPGV